jgi:hypothetical protein
VNSEPLDSSTMHAIVDVVERLTGVAYRLCLTKDHHLLLLDASGQSATELSLAAGGITFHPLEGGGGELEIDSAVLHVAPTVAAATLHYFLRWFGLEPSGPQLAESEVPSCLPSPSQPGWYPDPTGRFSSRYFNKEGLWERLCKREDGREVHDGETDPALLNDKRSAIRPRTAAALASVPTGPGWYPDPTGKYVSRYFNTTGRWERLCKRDDGREVRDLETDPTLLNTGLTALPKQAVSAPALKPVASTAQTSIGTFAPGVELAGSNGSVRVEGRFIVITRGLAADVLYGNLRGTKSIPIRSVQAVQMKMATRFVGGAIEFVVAGDHSSTGRQVVNMGNGLVTAMAGRQVARMGNENVVTFNLKQQPAFLKLHNFLIEAIEQENNVAVPASVAPPPTAPNLTDQLERLRRFHEEGVLSDEEFVAAKSRLLTDPRT